MTSDRPGPLPPTPENLRALDDWLVRLLDASEDERDRIMQRVPEEIRDDVGELLSAALADDDVLHVGGALHVGIEADDLDRDDEPSLIGSSLGSYRLLEELGRGGMGRVYLAERADGLFERQVAIKVVHLDARPHDRRALLRELRILARLDHPGIARLHDAGFTDAGDPYLVMERVEGRPIDAYCRDHGLDLRARLGLLVEVCGAVEAAHRQLIVHRDLKPSNVLVDDSGAVKLLDFGISQILAEEWNGTATEDAPQEVQPTGATTHRGFTPRYASPEQRLGQPVTTRSDVYQLGLLLRELAQGLVSEGTAAGPVAFTTAVSSTDLAAILARALADAPERRYGSADRLREDLENLLAWRPVQAASTSRIVRCSRFLRRRWRTVLPVALGVLLLLSASIAFVWRLAVERDATRQQAAAARRANEETERVLEYLTGLFRTSDPFSSIGAGQSPDRLTAREMLDRSVEHLPRALQDQPLARARLLTVLGGIYRDLGLFDAAEPLILEGLELRESTAESDPQEVVQSLLAYGNLLDQRGDYEEATEFIERAVSFYRGFENASALANALQIQGRWLVNLDRYAEAVVVLAEATTLWRSAERPEREAQVLTSLAHAHTALEQDSEALSAIERSLTLLEARLGTDHPSLAPPLVSLANFHSDRGRPEEALPHLTRAVELIERSAGNDDPRLAALHNNLGVTFTRMGSFDAARTQLLQALDRYRAQQPDHPDIGEILNNLGTIEWELGHATDAEIYYREALELLLQTYSEEHRTVAFALFNLGEAILAQERWGDADRVLRRAHDSFRAAFGEDHVMVSYPQLYLAQTAEALGLPRRALALLSEAVAIRRASAGEDSPLTHEALQALTALQQRQQANSQR